VRGHHPAAEDTGSYLPFKPAALSTSNSDYMAMPGVLKVGTVEAGGCASDLDRSNKLQLSSHAAAVSSSAGLHGSDYMQMAAPTVHSLKVVSEPGNKKVPEVSLRKLSTGSRGGDGYMRMQTAYEEDYADMKNVPYCCTGWL